MPPNSKLRSVVRTVTPQLSQCVTLRLDCSLLFKPGQAISVFFPGDPKKRYFSLSSSPTEPGYIEITVKCDESNPLTAIVQKLKRGDALDIDGPFGDGLLLPHPQTLPICMVAAGTGVTPFRSMAKFLVDQGSPTDVWLLHSVKRRDDLLFRDDFTEWSGHNPWFHYVPTITQDADDNWINETGRINQTLLMKHIPQKPTDFLICGPTEFVKDIEALLKRFFDVPEERIRKEKW